MTLKDNGDGSISDSRTGLMWQQAENGEEMNYEDAVAFCESLTLAGRSDWRLPTKEELVGLAQIGDEPLRAFFPGLQQERYWAFTRLDELAWAESPDRIAYTVDFDPDSGNYRRPTTYFRSYKYRVRAVCAGGETPRTASEASGAEGYRLRHALTGHTSGASACAFSPDGARIVTASWDKTARVWDAASGAELAVLTGHTDVVRASAFSPDGARIVTASDDMTARVWDAATGAERAVLTGHIGTVWACAFSPDGARIVTASYDKTARVWDAASGANLAVLTGHTEGLEACAFSPDGARIVTASYDNTARVWDAASGAQLAVLTGHTGSVFACAFSPDGARIVTASSDNTARVWEMGAVPEMPPTTQPAQTSERVLPKDALQALGSRVLRVLRLRVRTASEASGAEGYRLRHALTGHTNVVRGCAFSPDGARIVTASVDGTARVWDAASGAELAVLTGHTGVVSTCAFSPDGARIVTAGFDKTARVWDAASGAELAVLTGHTESLGDCAFSPDGARIVTASVDGTARVWEMGAVPEMPPATKPAQTPERVLPNDALRALRARARTASETSGAEGYRLRHALTGHTWGVSACAFSPDGARIVTASYDNTARVWDASSGAELAVLTGHTDEVWACAFSPDGARIVTASSDMTARVWDAASGAELAVLTGHTEGLEACAFSPDGARIVTARSGDMTARVWDAASGAELAVLTGHTDVVHVSAFSPDGKRIVTASWDKTARVWDAANGAELAVLTGHAGQVYDCAFSPDGARIVTAGFDKTARVWDAASGAELAVLTGHTESLGDCAFSPDGARIVTASHDKTARVWDAASGAKLAVLTGHTGYVYDCAFSPDGARIVTASHDETARVWDAATGAELAVLTGHTGSVWACAFSPDGARIVTASSDKTARVWEMGAVPEMPPTTQPAQTAERVLPNDALRALRARVEQLGVDHPRQQRPGLDPRLDMQLPWISRTLEEAASALESGRDPFGNPITDAQVVVGLRTLIQMVCDPGYLSAMDLGHPGIKAPLTRCMDDLKVILRDIEGTPATASLPPTSKGIKTLVALCTELGILFPDRHVAQAVEELRQEGEPGSRALAVLIGELMECRSPKITHVLEAAGRVTPTPELLDAVRAVVEASELTEAPAHPRFTPEIVGGGRVGWTSGTHSRIVAEAHQAAESLQKP